MPKLTTRTIDAIKPNGKRDVLVWDDDLPAFGIRVWPSGAKTFILMFRNANGRVRKLTLGRYGVITPDQARKQAKVRLLEVASGEDPAEQKIAGRNAVTVKELCEAYLTAAETGKLLTKSRKPKKATTLYTDRGRIERHIVPLLGRRTVVSITPTDIRKFQDDVADGKTAGIHKTKARGKAVVVGGTGTATRTTGLLSGIFTWAVEQGYRADNPVLGIKRHADGKRKVRLDADGYLRLGDELRRLAATGARWQAISQLRVIALTGCRLGEAQALKVSEIDFAGHCLRLSDSKTGESARPLGQTALDVLRNALEQAGSSQWVFPAAKGDGFYQGLPKVWRGTPATRTRPAVSGIQQALGVSGMTLHGLRHSFTSVAEADLGYPAAIVKALVGHAGNGVHDGYVHALPKALIAAADDIADETAVMMGDAVRERDEQALAEPAAGNVIEMPRRRRRV
ncbi:integrase arm-type DNA-binding domain-containing protein [Mesorhizobium sp. WSM2561]|uniref:tyrosine-type recombinase/integrase n=1 Tax=Mesorhizobium sp. WSM2561 TaxID=1040985 RepID=UPI0004B2FE88|nr:integrase arm-type DNA-binding domain-containing protein [Mesorhizobium sp. WSM2561]